ncbi:xanthine dehydrogenase small subunit [Caldimonas sp. KR1-144]|uniref:xanthine dehydrogenase small subunit n=1 Tax=Caldimonas sp. KR1-144 TaxID=3400911 RepID=UPI003C127D6B
MSQADSATTTGTRPLRFFHRGAIVEITHAAPTRSVLQWLREDARACGTKEGCNEGDCGACTVMLGSLAANGSLSLRSVNACLTLLPMLDGQALFTVEDLKAVAGGALHPVQQALVECHGSQCGFCTPGFAMSMAACYERHGGAGTRPTRQELADELSGNLCRCTGYRPILDAGERMFELPAARLDAGPVIAALKTLAADAPLRYEAANPATGRVERFDAPRSVDALAALLEAAPGARLLAGATDIGLWINKQMRELPHLVHVGAVAELKRVTLDGDTLVIGAAVPLEDAWAALAEHVPSLRELWLRFASPPVRHAGTMGGNLANGSPIGDSAPALIALGASLRLRRGPGQRVLPLDEFYVDYMSNRLEPGEFVAAIEVPLPSPAVQVRGWKLAKRYDSDISAIACGLSLTLAADGTVADARFAFGGMAAIVKRARAAEAAVIGQAWNEATVDAAVAALAGDFTPLTDLRASRDYRLRAAGNLLRRLWLETRADAPLAPSATSVWHARLVPATA